MAADNPPQAGSRPMLLQQIQSLTKADFDNDADRVQVKEALNAALSRLETPWETALRIVSTQPALGAALKVCHDIGLFNQWAAQLDGSPASADDLAKLVGADETLIARLLRHLYATHAIDQTSPGVYSLTDFSRSLATTGTGSMIPFLYNTTIPGFTNLPAFLASVRYVNPKDATNTNWHHMCGASRFEALKQRPAEVPIFQAVMAANSASKTPWVDLFPVDRLMAARRPGTALVVDVGGGGGHDVERLRVRLAASQPGELVLQDLQAQIDAAHVHESIAKMPCNFFEDQPVKGATAYYLHNVLHDWPDERAIAILKVIAAAAEPGYSRILIHEAVVTNDPPAQVTTLDMQMLMVHNAFERTESEWRRIVALAGLEVAGLWQAPGSVESIIEAVKTA